MNFDAMFSKGCLAWKPSSLTSSLDTWHEYEIPLVGTFEFCGKAILFQALGEVDASMRSATWAYMALPDDAPDSFESVSAMYDWLHDVADGARVAYSVTRDLRISHFSAARTVGSVYEGASDFLDEVLASMERKPARDYARFAAVQAEVEVSERDLVDA